MSITQMVNTRQSTPEFSGPAFDEAVQRVINALLPGLTPQNTNKLRQNGAGGSSEQPPTIHTWLERFGKKKPRSFSSATTLVDAENWIAHIEKLFEVLGCADEFKARLASYKLEGDALSWWKAVKQAKGGETYVATLPWKDFRELFFLQYFPRLAGFLGKKAGTQEKQAKNFKWALCDWILDGIVNTEFTDVAQVANVARNIKILHERSVQNNKRNRDWDCIRPTTQGNNQRGHDQKRYDGRGYDRQGQKGYPNYASSPLCETCGKLHPGKACYRVTEACFICGSTGHMARDCPKNSRNDGKGSGNDKQPDTKGRVFSSTKEQAANSSGEEFCKMLNKRDWFCSRITLLLGTGGYQIYSDASKKGLGCVLMQHGATKMYGDLKQHLWWNGMKQDIATFVARCLTCQQVKIEHQRASGLFQPLDIPVWKWDEISMDFVTGLPRTKRKNDAIWVVVDFLTKSAHFLPIQKDFSVSRLAEIFQQEIIRLHGTPAEIVSDRDPRFTSRFWKGLQNAWGTRLKFSTAFHP
ncbi:putative reverse transcriptase domain-containing protein [Tanacetum coccineum]